MSVSLSHLVSHMIGADEDGGADDINQTNHPSGGLFAAVLQICYYAIIRPTRRTHSSYSPYYFLLFTKHLLTHTWDQDTLCFGVYDFRLRFAEVHKVSTINWHLRNRFVVLFDRMTRWTYS